MSTRLFAKRVRALDKETSLAMLARAKEMEAAGRKIIHLEIGEPDFETPQNVIQAGMQALQRGYTHYGPSPGLPQARQAIAKHISADRGVDVDADQVVITPGAKAIIFFSVLALVESGDEVIFPSPGFPNYEMTVELLGGKPVALPLLEKDDFSIDLDRLESLVTENTKLCVINSPHNPTGSVLSREVLEGVVDIARRHDFYILSDEIYSKIVYEGTHASVYSIPGARECTILLDGHSKTYAMTGWRLGYGVMPEDLAVKLSQVAGNSTSCTCSFTQIAGIEALAGPQDSVTAMVEEFRIRRDIMVEGLNRIPGFRCRKPTGAFYVFPNITATKMTSRKLTDYLLSEAGVAVLSGTTFGEYGEGYIRISYANSQNNIRRALDSITSALDAL